MITCLGIEQLNNVTAISRDTCVTQFISFNECIISICPIENYLSSIASLRVIGTLATLIIPLISKSDI